MDNRVESFPATTHPRTRTAAALYLVALSAAEVAGPIWGAAPSTIAHGVLLILLLNHYVLVGGRKEATIFPALALLPLLRLLSLTMPQAELPPYLWYGLVALPLLLAAWLLGRLLGEEQSPPTPVGAGGVVGQLLVGLVGIPLGLLATLLFRPAPLVDATSMPQLLLAALTIGVGVGVVEELLFRGELQRGAIELFGTAGLLYSAALYAIMYVGTLQPGYILFMALLGLGLGWLAWWGRSLVGVSLAHALFAIILLVGGPLWL